MFIPNQYRADRDESHGCCNHIVFNFPMPIQGQEIKSLPLESESTVETVCLLSKLHEAKHHISVKVDMDELDLTSAEAKATYKEQGQHWRRIRDDRQKYRQIYARESADRAAEETAG